MKEIKLLIISALLAFILQAQEQTIPTGGESMFNPSNLSGPLVWRGTGTFTYTTVSVTGNGFNQALELDIIQPAANNWDGQIRYNLSRSVSEGDVALLHFWMRATESEDETGAGAVLAMIEQNGGSFTKSVITTSTASSDWFPFYIPFSFAADYAAGGVQIKFGLGEGRPRKIQIAGLQLINYGDSRTIDELPETEFTYIGRQADAPWRNEANTRIETHRKGDFALTFVDPSGKPIARTVRLELARHAFHFAGVIDAQTLNGNGPDNAIYREKVVELFNASGTENDLKWPPLAGDWSSSFNYAQTSNALEWLRLRGFFLRGHVLVWPGINNLPRDIVNRLSSGGAQKDEIPDIVLEHIDQTVKDYSPWIEEWDVLNEPYTNTDLLEEFGDANPALYADWFRAAGEVARPGVGLYLNDYSILSGLGQNLQKRASTIATLNDIQNRGGPITGMGFQGHFNESSLTAIPYIYSILEEFAAELPNLRFRITEFDLDTENESLQADYLRDFLTIVFSHPKVDGFQLWGFWEGQHWKPSAAFFKMDWTPREQVQAYKDLLAGWHSAFELKTDENGTVAGRGFKGTYTGTVVTDDGTYDLSLPVTQSNSSIHLVLPTLDPIIEPTMLEATGAGLLAIIIPTNSTETYWLETSLDMENWQANSLPQDGTGHPLIQVIETPLDNTYWRVGRGTKN